MRNSKTMNNENIKMISWNKRSADPISLVFLLLLLGIVIRFPTFKISLMGGSYCLPKNMMRIINTFGALIVCFEIGLLESKIPYTYRQKKYTEKSTLGTSKAIYIPKIVDWWLRCACSLNYITVNKAWMRWVYADNETILLELFGKIAH